MYCMQQSKINFSAGIYLLGYMYFLDSTIPLWDSRGIPAGILGFHDARMPAGMWDSRKKNDDHIDDAITMETTFFYLVSGIIIMIL